ncbi:hypothetical protein [Brevibacillus brevis]|uniref:hypothetical protein n=1 Tax=Brevibacillus brevis TaxID=1393 RepID=UPI000D0EF3AF|nr:hypothetical protein [Brevibacillus brevis]PSJ66905.1 hypothetical protein C7J99_24250 [Brevibacillus brevis]RED36047.1 hypothetical protein DES34_101717 [Brevibacillus brevis]GEC88534.1 hypothetical protein BBR01nite_08650 [Brevibacillus brevis]VEF88843.1 Uncharacterised protein [Brevibacillus brevis]
MKKQLLSISMLALLLSGGPAYASASTNAQVQGEPKISMEQQKQEQQFTKYYYLTPGQLSPKEAIYLKKGQELRINPRGSFANYTVYHAENKQIWSGTTGIIIKADADGYRYVQFQAPYSYEDQNVIVATFTIQ